MTSISILALGHPTIHIDGQPVKFKLKRSKALLIYCALEERLIARDHLCLLFWPDVYDEAKARRHLNNAIFRLRRDLLAAGDPEKSEDVQQLLLSSREAIQISKNTHYFCDVTEFERLTETNALKHESLQELDRAATLYQGEFLGSFHIPKADPSFHNWTAIRRSNLEIRYQALLQTLSARHLIDENYAAAAHYLQQLIAGELDTPEVVGLLMLCYSLLGNQQQLDNMHAQLSSEDGFRGADYRDLLTNLYKVIQQTAGGSKQIQSIVARLLPRIMEPTLRNTFEAILNGFHIQHHIINSHSYNHVLHAAQLAAIESGFELIGTPHLFLALCGEADPIYQHLQKVVSFNFTDQASQMRQVMQKRPAQPEPPLPHTLALSWVLTRARALAEQEEAGEVGTKHLWYALLETKSILSYLLAIRGCDRQKLLAVLKRI